MMAAMNNMLAAFCRMNVGRDGRAPYRTAAETETTMDNPFQHPLAGNRATKREKAILNCAAHIFAKRGYRQTDVQEIADKLGLGKGTVYRHFATKENLFLSAVDWGMRRLQACLRTAREQVADPLAAAVAAVRAYLAFFDDHPEFAELFIQERAEFHDRRRPTYFEYQEADSDGWRDFTRTLISQGRFRDIPPDRVLTVVNDLLYGTLFTGLFGGHNKSLAAQADDIVDVLFHGILSPAEKKRQRQSMTTGTDASSNEPRQGEQTADNGQNA